MQDAFLRSNNLFAKLNRIPIRLILNIISYLGEETIELIYQEIQGFLFNQNKSKSSSTFTASSINHFQTKKTSIASKNANIVQLSFLSDIHLKNNLFRGVQQANLFIHLLTLESLLNRYVKCTDRSMYFGLYEENLLIQYERGVTIGIVEDPDHSENFVSSWISADQKIKNIYQQIIYQLNSYADITETEESEVADFIEELKLTFNDPEIPMPKLRKEGIGSYCNSILQYHLVDQYHPSNKLSKKKDFDCQPPEFLSPLLSYPLASLIHESNNQTIQKQHNFDRICEQTKLIIVKKVIELFVGHCQMTQKWINVQQGDFQKFFTFMNRYNIYRGILIGVQKLIGGILREEDNKELNHKQFIYECKNGFIDVGLEIWKNKLKKFHSKNEEIYIKILHYYTSKTLGEYIQSDQSKPEYLEELQYNWLLNTLKLKRISISTPNKGFPSPIKDPFNTMRTKEKIARSLSFMSQIYLSEIQEYFLEDQFLQEQFLKEFIEYYIDLCVDEVSVNWCGHSRHALRKEYLSLETEIMKYGRKCSQYYLQICSNAQQELNKRNSRELKDRILRYLMGNHFRVWDSGLIKPTTLSKLLTDTNQLIQKWKQNNQIKQLEMQGEQGEDIYYDPQFGMNIKQCDKIIQYHNEEVWGMGRMREG